MTHVLGIAQAWLGEERLADTRLAIVTRGAVAVGSWERMNGLAASGVWGLVRSVQSEHPGRCLLIDTDELEGSWEAVASILGSMPPRESQLAVRAGVAHVPRLTSAGSREVLAAPAGATRWKLASAGGGTLEALALIAEDDAGDESLAPGQVRVAMRAAGLNFRDVLIALGMYPGEATLGGEGAGVVLAIGSGVEGIAVGDRVMGVFEEAFGPVAETDWRLLAGMPEGWSFARAASVPSVFLTAYYALVHVARLERGERVLIHAAAGGVGMAAVQIARHLGAEVLATASAPKWGTLHSLGLDEEHIASSRTLEFRERFLEQTEGAGVDVVLNSLAGDFVDASLGLLVRGGRFVEMGKADIRESSEIAERHPGVSYRAFDLAAVEVGARAGNAAHDSRPTSRAGRWRAFRRRPGICATRGRPSGTSAKRGMWERTS